MNKAIERAQAIINKAIADNNKKYEEAVRSYGDTGYDRYRNKMQKLEKELEELNGFSNGKSESGNVSASTYKELDELKRAMKSLKSKWDYLKVELNLPTTADTVAIDDIFREFC